MFEYAFFDAALKDRFVALLREQTLPFEEWEGDDGYTVAVSEDIADPVMDRLEACYDALLDEQHSRVAGEEVADATGIHRVGVQYTDNEGAVGQVHLDPQLVNRLLRAVAIEELQQLVQTVATQVLDGGGGALCKRP